MFSEFWRGKVSKNVRQGSANFPCLIFYGRSFSDDFGKEINKMKVLLNVCPFLSFSCRCLTFFMIGMFANIIMKLVNWPISKRYMWHQRSINIRAHHHETLVWLPFRFAVEV